MEFKELYQRALAVTGKRGLSEFAECGVVGAAILTEAGNVYVGVNVDIACGIGFCAEHSAAAAMLTAGECRIKRVIAVGERGNIMPPCGRCREFMSQLSDSNRDAEVMVAEDKTLKLSQLLPFDWRES